MTTNSVAVQSKRAIARPLKVLIPLIKDELESGDRAGLEHYCRAGQMLLEAKEQMPWGSWTKWLGKNFELSQRTADRYMRLAQLAEKAKASAPNSPHVANSTRDYTRLIGERPVREQVQGTAWKRVTAAARDLDADLFAQERQNRDDEVRLHRELAVELIDIGYKALATRLHPDRGGSKDAMVRLNRVREQLIEIAKSRRFI
jgi:hypothetical protein